MLHVTLLGLAVLTAAADTRDTVSGVVNSFSCQPASGLIHVRLEVGSNPYKSEGFILVFHPTANITVDGTRCVVAAEFADRMLRLPDFEVLGYVHPNWQRYGAVDKAEFLTRSGKPAAKAAAAVAAPKVTVYKFFSKACPPCKVFAPTFDRWAEKHKDRGKFVMVDTELKENFDLVQKYKIEWLPSVIVTNGDVFYSFSGNEVFTAEPHVEKFLLTGKP